MDRICSSHCTFLGETFVVKEKYTCLTACDNKPGECMGVSFFRDFQFRCHLIKVFKSGTRDPGGRLCLIKIKHTYNL